MGDEVLAGRYAAAIFQLAQERGVADVVGRDLQTLDGAIADDAPTSEFFRSPVIDRSEKEHVLTSAFEGKIDDVALHALLLLVRKRREALLHGVTSQYARLQMAARGTEPLSITSAHALAPEQLRAMVTRLEQIYGKKFEVTTHVEPDLIGGVRVAMGDRRIDGTVAGRLDELARDLFAAQR